MAKGYRGAGVMSFKWTKSSKGQAKDIVAGARQPMPAGYRGRVLYPGKGKAGVSEGTK